ncbi:MAG: hypothetical protein LBJ67_13745 [Planctomycetaceae bacterium]|nr:hypothetical protein [Planctomycetaceae bacterium]
MMTQLFQYGMSVLFVLFLGIFSLVFGDTLQDIEKVEKQTLHNRRAIKSWHVRTYTNRILHEETGDVLDNEGSILPNGDIQRRLYTDYYYDGQHTREDTFFEYGTPAQQGIDFFSWDDRYCYLYTTGLDDEKGKFAIQADTVKEALEKRGGIMPFLDIRIFGMFPTGLALRSFELTSRIGNPDRTNLEMTDDTIEGIACKKISFLDHRQNSCVIWIATELGYNPIRFDSWNDEKGFRNTVNLKIEKHKESGIWFPVSSIGDELYKGKPYSHTEDRVEIISFNKPFPIETFGLKEMNAPVGTRVYIVPPPNPADNFFWDGEKIASEFGTVLEPLKPAISSRSNTL